MKTTVEFIMEFSGAVILLFAVSGLFAKLSGCQYYDDDIPESNEDTGSGLDNNIRPVQFQTK